MKYAVFLLALFVTSVQAEVYKSINADGEVIYSDVPSQGAQRVQMPELPTYSPAPLPVAPAAPQAPPPVAAPAYSNITVSKPDNDETIRSNAGILNVSVTLAPALQIEAGHRVQFFLDGKPLGKPIARSSTSFRNVDRGTHAITAAVIDDSGASLVTSAAVTVHLLRASIQQPNNPLNTQDDAGKNNSSNNGAAGGAPAASSSSSSSSGTSSGAGATGSTGSSHRSTGF